MLDWTEILDLQQASATVRTDIFGDWHRDPWGWPEHEWLISSPALRHVIQALNDAGARHGTLLDVAKENFSIRPAYIFDPVDRLIFQALVDRVSVQLVGDMPGWSYSWRLSRVNPKPGRYVNMRSEWEGYRKRLVKLSGLYDAALTTDIVSFFPSIPIDQLIDAVIGSCGTSAVVDRLSELLQAWSSISGRSGLPMRANGSSILASRYLRPLDELLLRQGQAVRGRHGFWNSDMGEGTAARWVDDIWLFGDDRADLRMAQLDIEEVLRSLGLHMNLAKTKVLEGEEMVRAARTLEHSAVEVGLEAVPDRDYGPLNELLDRLLSDPENASHTSVRFATVRMRRHHRYERIDEFVDVAPRMPHCSAYLARSFRDSGGYRDLGRWFGDYLVSKWARIELAAANLAMMFPASESPPEGVADSLEERMNDRPSLSLFAIGCQRLAGWRPQETRAVLRELAQRTESPAYRRVLALAALAAGEERKWIADLLSEFKENAPTLEFLKERNFRHIPAQADFSGY